MVYLKKNALGKIQKQFLKYNLPKFLKNVGCPTYFTSNVVSIVMFLLQGCSKLYISKASLYHSQNHFMLKHKCVDQEITDNCLERSLFCCLKPYQIPEAIVSIITLEAKNILTEVMFC